MNEPDRANPHSSGPPGEEGDISSWNSSVSGTDEEGGVRILEL